MLRALSLLCLSGLAACSGQAASGAKASGAQGLAADMAGVFANERITDARTPIAPLGEGAWLYYQVDREGAVYRQRVLHLEDGPAGTVRQTAYSLSEPERFAGLADRPTRAALQMDFTPGCEMIWRKGDDGWSGAVDPQNCTIFSERRQTSLRIGARSELAGDRLRMGESGYQMDGRYLWGSRPGEWLELTRQP